LRRLKNELKIIGSLFIKYCLHNINREHLSDSIVMLVGIISTMRFAVRII